MAFTRSFYACLTLFLTLARSPIAAFAQEASATGDAPPAVPTDCGDIIEYANQDLQNNWLFYASDVYDCLVEVPFLDDVALRYIDYFNYTIQFQSTLSYLKNPPSGYQQPGVDVVQALADIKQNITAGFYQNEYDFEATLQLLVQRMHDSHVSLDAGALSAFTFGSPYDLMSVSVDGKQAPKVYVNTDVIAAAQSGGPPPSAITAINGVPVVQYLQEFAANQSFGMLEPNADWNQLMYSPVQDILGTFNLFGWNAVFYPGDALNFTFENGTEIDTFWLAYYVNPQNTGPLATGGDFYNYFVLGLIPASYDPNLTDVDNSTSSTGGGGGGDGTAQNTTSWFDQSPAYPQNADVVQSDLSVGGGGWITGYFLTDISTGVISIPSFDETGDFLDEFADTVAEFIQRAQAAGLTKIVIDLQQNAGGETLLAFDTFRQFFPNIKPFGGSRRRIFDGQNNLGEVMTGFWESLDDENSEFDYGYYHDPLSANEWVITDRLNAANEQNFSSWAEYSGPVAQNGDTFSLTEQYDLADEVFDLYASGGYIPEARPNTNPPWGSQNIILLTDGICGSTCSLFVEMMKHEAGVRTVVVGGLPSGGPMQAASGSRGARSYYADDLDSNIAFAQAVNETANTTLPTNRDQAIFTYYMGFNLRDQLRRDDPTPLQFQYVAADCRIYYTFANAYSLERLWRDAAAAIWTDPSLCVAGSTGFSTTGASTPPNPPPSSGSGQSFFGVDSGVKVTVPPGVGLGEGLTDKAKDKQSKDFGPCDNSCQSGFTQNLSCGDGSSQCVCTDYCFQAGSCAGGHGFCSGLTRQPENKAFQDASLQQQQQQAQLSSKGFYVGHCVPDPKQVFCSANGRPSLP